MTANLESAAVALRDNLITAEVAIRAAQDALAAIAAQVVGLSGVLTPPLFSQREPEWSSHQLGTSDKTIGSHGCVVTCLAMILQAFGLAETPASVNEKMTARHGYHSTNHVIWESVQRIWPSVNFMGRFDCITVPAPTAEINRRLALGFPVIAWLDFDERPGIQQHFVLLVEAVLDNSGETVDYHIHDPWTGKVNTLVGRYAQDVAGKPWLAVEEGVIQGVRYYEPSGAT